MPDGGRDGWTPTGTTATAPVQPRWRPTTSASSSRGRRDLPDDRRAPRAGDAGPVDGGSAREHAARHHGTFAPATSSPARSGRVSRRVGERSATRRAARAPAVRSPRGCGRPRSRLRTGDGRPGRSTAAPRGRAPAPARSALPAPGRRRLHAAAHALGIRHAGSTTAPARDDGPPATRPARRRCAVGSSEASRWSGRSSADPASSSPSVRRRARAAARRGRSRPARAATSTRRQRPVKASAEPSPRTSIPPCAPGPATSPRSATCATGSTSRDQTRARGRAARRARARRGAPRSARERFGKRVEALAPAGAAAADRQLVGGHRGRSLVRPRGRRRASRCRRRSAWSGGRRCARTGAARPCSRAA